MANDDSTSLRSFLHELIPAPKIRQTAVDVGFLRRRRKIDPVEFVAATVLTLGRQDGNSINRMRQTMAMHGGARVVRSSFLARWNEPFEQLVSWLLERLQQFAKKRVPSPSGLLAPFHDVLAVDATVVTLRKQLKELWPGTRQQAPAAIKVHTMVRVVTGELVEHCITGERVRDHHVFGRNSWRQGALYLFDRGYSSVHQWYTVSEAGAFFLIPLKSVFKPTIVASHRKHRAGRLVGLPLRGVLARMPRKVIDVECTFKVRRPPHNNPLFDTPFRVVGVWNHETKRHHLYVTNIPAQWLGPEHVARIYRLRWEVETFYKTAKSGLGLHQITSTKPHVVRTFVAAALIRATLAMQAKIRAECRLPGDRWINPGQWVRLWREALIEMAFGPAHRAVPTKWSWSWLAQLAADPNRGRKPTRRAVLEEKPNRAAPVIQLAANRNATLTRAA